MIAPFNPSVKAQIEGAVGAGTSRVAREGCLDLVGQMSDSADALVPTAPPWL